MPSSDKIIQLALSFPALQCGTAEGYHRMGLRPWNPEMLKRWSRTASSGERKAALFVLSVWNTANKFDVHDALLTWDNGNRAAFAAWAAAPWWM
jgi:hypothetical protein